MHVDFKGPCEEVGEQKKWLTEYRCHEREDGKLGGEDLNEEVGRAGQRKG